MTDIVKRFNEERNKILRSSEKYLELINKFLGDSGKKVQFNENGYLYFSTKNSEIEHSMATLSSGEAQIFVLLTHLAFSQEVKADNVLIIDEPELSLHVQWQELFVDSVLSVNPHVQYIMATHSPSIIMERIGKCKDISNR